MERLNDEELLKTILEWMDTPSQMYPEGNAKELLGMIREAERGKGVTTVNGCAECAKNLYHVFSHSKPTPYADKVLEVAGHIIAGTWARTGGYEIDFAIETAIKLITAANEAASQKASKETK